MKRSLSVLVAGLALTALPVGNAGAAVPSPVCVATPALSCTFTCVDGLALAVVWAGQAGGGANASCGGASASCGTDGSFCAGVSPAPARAMATTTGTCRADTGVAVCSVAPVLDP